MAHLLHIDSSIQGDRSISRKLTARAADVWRTAHPRGTVTYRDLGSNPVPHLDAVTGVVERQVGDSVVMRMEWMRGGFTKDRAEGVEHRFPQVHPVPARPGR